MYLSALTLSLDYQKTNKITPWNHIPLKCISFALLGSLVEPLRLWCLGIGSIEILQYFLKHCSTLANIQCSVYIFIVVRQNKKLAKQEKRLNILATMLLINIVNNVCTSLSMPKSFHRLSHLASQLFRRLLRPRLNSNRM